MAYKDIPIGRDVPNEVNAFIENPTGGDPVKYELDKDSEMIFVDRFLHTAMYYPGNYGFIPHTLSGDGDPVDILVLGDTRIVPGVILPARPIGVLITEDEAGMDEKIIAVPPEKLYPQYGHITDYHELPEILFDRIQHFFEHYKDLEKNKWVKTVRWGDAEDAKRIILEGIERAKEIKKSA